MMADFVQTMKDWRRMCAAMRRCEDCPLNGLKCWAVSPSDLEDSFDEREAKIATWGHENPEPVYLTWAEYLNSIGVTISDRPFPAPNIPVYVYQAGAKMFEPIPADIAKKLGIEPKEG